MSITHYFCGFSKCRFFFQKKILSSSFFLAIMFFFCQPCRFLDFTISPAQRASIYLWDMGGRNIFSLVEGAVRVAD